MAPFTLPADPLATTNPSHGADIGESLARLLAAIVLPLVFRVGDLRDVERVLFIVFVCFHAALLDHFASQLRV
jgi:hypothetical protein